MRALKAFGLIGICVALAASPVAAAVVTFDDLVGQAAVPDGYGGINWGGVWTYYGFAQPPYTPHSSPNRVYTPCCGSGEFQFSFVSPDQTFNGSWFSGTGGTTVEYRLYNDGILVSSGIQLAVSETPTFLASGYGSPVDVVGIFSNANDFYVMDDVTYGGPSPSPVPEPTTFLLWGTAAAGFGLLRRRFRSPD